MRIVVVWPNNYWSLFRTLGMCYELFHFSYRMILRHLLWSLFRTLGMCYELFHFSYRMILRHLLRWADRVLKFVECTVCSMRVLVRCFLRQSVVPCCSVLPKYEEESENPSPRSLLTFHGFAQLSHLVAVTQGVCCFNLTSFCKYALFSFLKWR